MKKILCRLIACINVIIIIAMLVTGYAGNVNPAEHPYLSLLGFAFPAFLLANLLFLVIWVCVKWKYIILPVVGLLLAYWPVKTYVPLNFSSDTPTDAIKVLSYNVLYFNTNSQDDNSARKILQYLIDSEADIICLQEYVEPNNQEELMRQMHEIYPHHAVIASNGYITPGGAKVALFSKYPITSEKNIEIATRGNTAAAFVVDINGKTTHIINAHLETVGFSQDEKTQFGKIVAGKTEKTDMENKSRNLLRKLAQSAKIRGPQADMINSYIEQHKGERIIFCGDINDHPLSYVHNTIAENLTDCYQKAGCGPGFSFDYHSMYVRIDNIMCSEHFTPYNCRVDKSIRESDHYPISCILSE